MHAQNRNAHEHRISEYAHTEANLNRVHQLFNLTQSFPAPVMNAIGPIERPRFKSSRVNSRLPPSPIGTLAEIFRASFSTIKSAFGHSKSSVVGSRWRSGIMASWACGRIRPTLFE